MAIQVRRGNEADFDASKMLPGEWAVSLDAKYVRMCFAPGLVLRMATYESFEADREQIQAILAECKYIQTAIERIQVEVNSNAVLTVESANFAKESADRAHGEAERALSEADRAHSEAERAKSYMDGAESVIGVKIADLYQTKAGAIIEKASGESPLCIRDTADNLVRNLRLYGNTEQYGTSGAQLIEPKLKSATVNGITLTYNEDGTYTLNGTATAQTVFRIDQSTPSVTDNLKGYDGTYTLSLDGNTEPNVFATLTQTGTWTQFLNTLSKSSNTFTTENCYVAIAVGSGTTLSNYVVKPMLNAGSTALPWEPYTGGQPSPNPDYPQEIKSVVVNEVKARGGNQLFDKTKRTDGYVMNYANGVLTANANYFYSDYIKVSAGKYIVSGCSDQHLHMCFYDLEKKFESGQASGKVIDVPHGGYIVFSAKIAEVDAIMCNAGTVALPLEPYISNSITLSQPIELHEGDLLTPDGVVRKIFVDTEIVATGVTAITLAGDKGEGYRVTCPSSKPIVPSTTKIASNAFRQVENWTQLNGCNVNGAGTGIYFQVSATDFPDLTVSAINEWMKEVGLTFVYELATPITEPLPTADQIALRSLLSYDGVTYLECDSEVVPTIEAECVLDTKRYIDRKFAELATALV